MAMKFKIDQFWSKRSLMDIEVQLWRVQFDENVILMLKACIEVIIFCQHDLLEFYHI